MMLTLMNPVLGIGTAGSRKSEIVRKVRLQSQTLAIRDVSSAGLDWHSMEKDQPNLIFPLKRVNGTDVDDKKVLLSFELTSNDGSRHNRVQKSTESKSESQHQVLSLLQKQSVVRSIQFESISHVQRLNRRSFSLFHRLDGRVYQLSQFSSAEFCISLVGLV